MALGDVPKIESERSPDLEFLSQRREVGMSVEKVFSESALPEDALVPGGARRASLSLKW